MVEKRMKQNGSDESKQKRVCHTLQKTQHLLPLKFSAYPVS